MIRTLKAILKSIMVLIDDSLTATAATTGVNLADFNAVMFDLAVGVFSFTGTNKVSVVMQHSDDDSVYTNCQAADMMDPEDGDNGIVKILDGAGDDNKAYQFHYKGEKKFVRLNLVVGGTVAVVTSVVAVLGYSEMQPPL